MTVVIGFKADKEAVMLSDSRASSLSAVEDKLQKILPIKENIALGYAGDVEFASYVADMLRQNLTTTTKANLKGLLSELQKIALSLYAQKPEPTDFMLGLITNEGEAMLYVLRHPTFDPVEINKGFELIGSGDVIKEPLVKMFENEKTDKDIKYIADKIFTTASSELAKSLKDDSVGGMFQIILLEKSGIRPIRYGYVDVDPDREPDSKSIEMQQGTWTQYDHTKNHKTDILKPEALLKEYPVESRFHDYKTDPQKKESKWHLLHFITCLALRKDVGITEFNGTLSALAQVNYPIVCEILLALEYWGSAGKHNLEFTLIKDGKSQIIYKETVESQFISVPVELVKQVKIEIDKPGAAILQININGKILVRRAMYFHKLQPEDVKKPNIGNMILEQMEAQNDLEMEKTKKPEVVCFAMCQDVEWNSLNLKLIQQSASFYWENYPLPLKQKIFSSFRLPKGENLIRIDLVDAATGEKWEVANKKMISTSNYGANPIVGEFLIEIPRPGLYFLNAIVNDIRLTSILFAAETSEAKYSYSLLEEDKNDVKNGQLLCLSKEATKNKSQERRASVIDHPKETPAVAEINHS